MRGQGQQVGTDYGSRGWGRAGKPMGEKLEQLQLNNNKKRTLQERVKHKHQ